MRGWHTLSTAPAIDTIKITAMTDKPPKSPLETNVTLNLGRHQPPTPHVTTTGHTFKYVSYDYEQTFWHIYSIDNDIRDTLGGHCSLLTIDGPDTPELQAAIEAIAKAIDDAVSIAEKIAGDR